MRSTNRHVSVHDVCSVGGAIASMAPYVPLRKGTSFHPTLVRSAPRTVTFGSFPMEPVSVVALILASQ